MSKGNRKRRRELGLLPEAPKCSARRQDGQPCGMSPVKGASVCRKHGGAAPQVKRKAQERLLQGVPKMLRMLNDLASDESIPPQVRLAAIRDWLDRAGLNAKMEVEVSSSAFEQMVAGVLVEVPDGTAIGQEVTYGDRLRDGDVVDAEVVEAVEEPADRDRDRDPTRPSVPAPRGRPYHRS